MADQPERRKAKRAPKRKPTKKSTSKISEAQQAAVKRRQERDTLRAQSAAEASKRMVNRDPNNPTIQAPARPDARMNSGIDPTGIIGNPVERGRQLAMGLPGTIGNKPKETKPGDTPGGGIPAIETPPRPLANPDLYGVTTASRVSRLQELKAASDASKLRALSENDNAVYMGPGTIKYRRSGPMRMDEYGSSVETIAGGDDIQTKDELMSWLADPAKVEAIKARALKAGLAVESYEDIAKLWESVVTQAATTFSRMSKKVTPWALIEMRGKYAGPNGKMQDKVTVSTQIDEMDPAQARGMLEQTASQMLGRAPSQAELDDFIAKAQMIARSNPAVTTTTSKVGFDGEVETGTSTSVTKGGGAAVTAQSQASAIDMAKQDEDYGAYQAAGTYFPLLFDALSSPV